MRMTAEQMVWEALDHGRLDLRSACRLFDSLAPVEPADLLGLWKGRDLATGHPLDGWLQKAGWYGKAFHSCGHVDPVLFKNPFGKPFPLHPAPLALLWKLAFHSKGAARLCRMEWRGKVSAAMVYDELPIHDHFRKVNEDVVMGMMDWKGMERPYFFLLARVYP